MSNFAPVFDNPNTVSPPGVTYYQTRTTAFIQRLLGSNSAELQLQAALVNLCSFAIFKKLQDSLQIL